MPSISINSKGTKIKLSASEKRHARDTADVFAQLAKHHPDSETVGRLNEVATEIRELCATVEVTAAADVSK